METLLPITNLSSEPDLMNDDIHNLVADAAFIAEAIRRAEQSGYRPAAGQREVNWHEVAVWTVCVQQPDFRWLTEREQSGTGYIIVGVNGAIASGQHRILGGLMGDRPVPTEACSILNVSLPIQDWLI